MTGKIMAEPLSIAKNDVKQAALRVRVVGKTIRVRKYEKHTYTTVICPAADEYSKPSIVEIRSSSRFADVDDKIDIHVSLGGYEGKSYAITDRESGERKNLVPVNHFLDLVE